MLGNTDGLIILGGDFNQILDICLDHSKTGMGLTPRARTAIHHLQEQLGLIDIWRLTNPKEREYTFYSHSHKTHANIYLFFF